MERMRIEQRYVITCEICKDELTLARDVTSAEKVSRLQSFRKAAVDKYGWHLVFSDDTMKTYCPKHVGKA